MIAIDKVLPLVKEIKSIYDDDIYFFEVRINGNKYWGNPTICKSKSEIDDAKKYFAEDAIKKKIKKSPDN
jgi:hypothetical protein